MGGEAGRLSSPPSCGLAPLLVRGVQRNEEFSEAGGGGLVQTEVVQAKCHVRRETTSFSVSFWRGLK